MVAYKVVAVAPQQNKSAKQIYVCSARTENVAKTMVLDKLRAACIPFFPRMTEKVNDSCIESCERFPQFDALAEENWNRIIAKAVNGEVWLIGVGNTHTLDFDKVSQPEKIVW